MILVLSKKAYEFALKKGRSINSSMYFSRKVIHFLAGGLTAMLLPFIAHEPILPAATAFGLALMTYLPHKLNRRMYWFQDPENLYDVDFTLSWGLVVFFTWFIDRSFWLGVIPVLFMAYGDGITGIIRNLKYNKRTKAWEGTAGMLVLCVIIGAKMGFAGIFAGIVCSFVERIENIDDNFTVPASGLLILLAAHYYFPSLTVSLY
ncbi:phytol kinase [Methanosarcina thermophila CHTI-55]|uniref:Phytol kinase n=1 Tax=Methanosarcina thermophila CHTI-55 TaxID=1434121 RepID=A0A0E3NEY0_METTE|nr:phytol kinase [Methanosarcina thermophila CHTI-55]